jgi:hypothetical protein
MPKNGNPDDEKPDDEKPDEGRDRKDDGRDRKDDELHDPKRFRPDPEATGRMIEEVFKNSLGCMHREVQLAVVRRVMGDTELFCPECGGFCHDRVARVRDCFMKRGFELCSELTRLFDLYFRTREAGIEESPEVLGRLYTRWAEVGMVYDMAEPQERIDPVLLGGPFGEDDEDEAE